MIHRLASAGAIAMVTMLAVSTPGLLAPPAAAADPSFAVRSIDWRRDRDHDRDRRQDHDRDRHGRRVIVVPRAYYVPTYVTPAPTWVPGYWTWRWVPQPQTSYAYVPGFYDQDGSWIASRYEPRTVEGGFYQQVWIDGYWQ